MTPNEIFNNYMSGLPPRARIAKSRDLRELGDLTPYQISNWRTGRVKIPDAWQRKINTITGDQVFSLQEN